MEEDRDLTERFIEKSLEAIDHLAEDISELKREVAILGERQAGVNPSKLRSIERRIHKLEEDANLVIEAARIKIDHASRLARLEEDYKNVISKMEKHSHMISQFKVYVGILSFAGGTSVATLIGIAIKAVLGG